ncbi:MAG: restriction endonuclease, partial [Microcoleaceae cyanobacterium]
ENVKNTMSTTSQAIAETVNNTTKNVGGIASYTTENVKNTMSTTSQAIAETIDHTSKNLGQTLADTTKVTKAIITQTTTEAGKLVKQVPGHVGNTINFINKNSLSQNPFLKKLMGNIKVDWLLNLINQVDIVSAQNAVNNLKEAYPTETPRQIAHRIILEKAAYLGTMGLVTSLVPGLSAALLTADLAVTTAIYAETIYQIAGAYGLPLQDPTRKGEILAVFGLTLGSNYAIKAGVGLLRNIPLAGAVIGAASNAALLYSLGYVACNFYEAQVQPQNLEAGLEEIEATGEMFLQGAIAQEIITDQILVHVYLAGNPGKTWQSVSSELAYLALSPASLQVLETLPEITPIEILLEQIQGDFAFALMAKCRAIAESDGVITPEEQQLLSLIQSKLNNYQIKNNWAEDLVKGAGKGLLDTFIDAKVSHSLLATLTDIINGKKVANYDDLQEVLGQVDQMSGVDFEQFLADLFRKKGYTVQMTPRTNDYGADLIISKFGKKTIVQAKRYSSKLNNSPIQEAHTAINHYQADNAMVITNNYFTANAQNLAQSNQVKL